MKLILMGLFFSALALAGTSDLAIREDGGFYSQATEGLLSRRGKLVPPPILLDPQELNRVMFSELQEQNEDLKRVKYFLINGETRLAQVHLTKLAFTKTKLRPVVYRYLGIMNFIEGRFKRSLDFLSKQEMNGSQYRKVCTLKILNMVVLDKKYELEDEWQRCTLENYNHFNEGNFVWLDILVQMKTNPRPGQTKVPFKKIRLSALDNNQLKIFLKLALYLNQEALIEPQIAELDLSQMEDTEVRDLVGHLLFRRGALAKSYRFIEDLKTPNAENMKGNLYILRQKYELAYAQFKLALEQKQNSQNAMERILPMAWLLGDWSEGSKIAERVIAAPQTQINKMTLMAAFLTQKGDYQKASDVIDAIIQRSRRGTEVDVTQLYSFAGLMQNRPHVVRKHAAASCSQYDMVNCWLSFQMDQWDSFPLTIRRAENLPNKREWETLSQESITDSLKEIVYVNQLDIEELDDKLIQLIPNAKNQ
jgi:hypothetical protein